MIRLRLCGSRRLWWCSVVAVATAAAACSGRQQPAGDPPGPKDRDPTGVRSAEELIQGRFAGVQVVRLAGGGFSLRIRGAGSLVSGNEPLYVVDGVTLPAAPGGALVGVDPRDIESIEVLKDISATSAYGVRGANGVIVIKTKRGR